jgi:Pyruvate kinase
MRKTKIIYTLGLASEKTETLRQLIQKGADIFRLLCDPFYSPNFSLNLPGFDFAFPPRTKK